MPSYTPISHDPFAGEREIEKITFTNEPQREIWLSCIIGGREANLSYNESVSLKMNGSLDVDAMKKAVGNLVLRHEALRATISPNGETLIIYKDVPLTFELEDLTNLPPAEVQKQFKAFVSLEMATPLDLIEGPLFKVFLHRTAEAEYYLTLIKHHIIGDGWSTGIMLEDLCRMYNAYINGPEITLPRAAQISDYASAQAKFRLSPEYKKTEDYWLDLYKDIVPVVDMPTDAPRPSPKTYKGDRIDRPLSKEMVARLKAVGAKNGASLVTTLLAAFEVFLYSKTHQRDLVVGLPSSGQAASGLNDVVGHCVNLLPLKTHIRPETSFTEYLKTRKKEVLDAYDHQRLTFGELLKKLYIPRDPSRIPLVPVMFNIDMGMDNAVGFNGIDFELTSNPRAYENFELYLNATNSKDGILLEWSFNTDLFKAETIDAFNKDYFTILEKIIANAGASIEDLAGKEISSKDLVPYTSLHIQPDQTFSSLFEFTAMQYASKTAVTFNKETLTYKQLDEKTAQFAAVLTQSGISKGDIVAISLDRSVQMLVSLLAVMRAGAAYLPLDPEYPLERTQFMLEDSGAKLLITSQEHKNKYPAATTLIIDDVWAKLKDQKTVPAKSVAQSDLAYILYTSGSTGKPKGVKITHLNLVNFLLSMQATPGIKDSDRLLAITSISFDIAGLELYLPLISGAELVLADTESTRDGRMLLNIIYSKDITIMQATPSTWQMLLDSGWVRRSHLKMLSGGEPLPKDLADNMLQRGDALWNMYGPTETTIWSTIKQVHRNDIQITIGFPIANTTVYVMDELGKPMPVNQPGEIYIGGAGVAEGYLHRPELTNEKFVADPYSTETDARLYRTGDVGKVLPDGEILCLGRIDHQVKIRGHRIELGEIEAAVAKQEGIKQAVVLAREDAPNDKRIIAYVTLDNSSNSAGIPSWKDRWDALYELGAEEKQNTTGESHNIDGTLLDQLENAEELNQQKAEWLNTTIARIKELHAKRIYEIGSGAGQVMFGLAPSAEFYMATDYAQAAITNINDRLKAEPEKWRHVKAAVAAADDFSAIGNTPIDLVVINSVAQYFPDADYLLRVIKQAAAALKQGGCIFIGDMQGKNSLEMFHAMDHLSRAADNTSLASFKSVVANRVRIEDEFVADPSFFYLLPTLLPRITGVDVQLRKGQSINETTKYHYDIWLYIDRRVEVVSPAITEDWQTVETLPQLETLLESGSGKTLEIKNIPNSRTIKDHKLLQLLHSADTDESLATVKKEVNATEAGLHPDAFWQLGDKMGYHAHIRWTTDGTDGLFNVVFIPSSLLQVIPSPPIDVSSANDIHLFARTPLFRDQVSIPDEQVRLWRDSLRAFLPLYMIPDDFVAMKAFPLTPNLKIDRKALPKPQQRIDVQATTRPLTPNEQLVTGIWTEALGMQNLQPTDDFFQLGGHSLLAVKVMVAIEKMTGKRLPIADLFNHSTIEKLALLLSDDAPIRKWDVLVPIKTTGSKTPVFLIHGGGLNILLFKSISDYFDPEQPVYGLQALGLNHETDIPPTIEQIATRYLNEIVEAYPSGPYALAGYSLGGFLAFEIAKQLKAMGKKVQFVGVMDTYTGNNYDAGGKVARLSKKVVRQFHKVPFFAQSFITNPKEAWEYQKLVARRKVERMNTDEIHIPKDIIGDYEAAIYKKYSDALDNYMLTPQDIEITLFRVAKRIYFLDDAKYLGWRRFARKGVHVEIVPGDHETFLYPPHGEQLGRILQQALNKAEKR